MLHKTCHFMGKVTERRLEKTESASRRKRVKLTSIKLLAHQLFLEETTDQLTCSVDSKLSILAAKTSREGNFSA